MGGGVEWTVEAWKRRAKWMTGDSMGRVHCVCGKVVSLGHKEGATSTCGRCGIGFKVFREKGHLAARYSLPKK